MRQQSLAAQGGLRKVMGLLHMTLHALRRANGADVKAERQLGYHIAETLSTYFKALSFLSLSVDFWMVMECAIGFWKPLGSLRLQAVACVQHCSSKQHCTHLRFACWKSAKFCLHSTEQLLYVNYSALRNSHRLRRERASVAMC